MVRPAASDSATLTTLGSARFRRIGDRRHQGRDVDGRDRPAAPAPPRTSAGSSVGRSPCRLTTTSCRPADRRSTAPRRCGPSPTDDRGGSARPVPPAAFTASAISALGAGDDHRADVRLHRPPPDLHDHRLAADVGERLAGQPRRRHARRDEDDRPQRSWRIVQLRAHGDGHTTIAAAFHPPASRSAQLACRRATAR